MKDYKVLAKQARLKVLEMVNRAQTSHIASNFSVIDIATVLYENLKEGDEVVWSKGWCAASIYYFLAKQGKIPVEDLDKFQNSEYLGLAETNVPGVLVNGGSVGHGLSVAVGMALGKKRANEPGTIYCIMSDGELNEGSVWEAAMLAGHHKLDNLIAIVDGNGWQAMGRTADIVSQDTDIMFTGAGWLPIKIKDGHDHAKVEKILEHSQLDGFIGRNCGGKPRILIAETIKGKGVSFMENHLLYHYKNLEPETYLRAKEEIEND